MSNPNSPQQQPLRIPSQPTETDQGTPVITLDISSPTKVVSKRKPKKKVSIEAPADVAFLEAPPETSRQVRNRSRSSPHGPRPAPRTPRSTILISSEGFSVNEDGVVAGSCDDSTEGSCYDSDSSSTSVKPLVAFSKLKSFISEKNLLASEEIEDWLAAIERGLNASTRKSERISRLTERISARTEKINQLNETIKSNAQKITELSGENARLKEEIERQKEGEQRLIKLKSEKEKEFERMVSEKESIEKKYFDKCAEMSAKEVEIAEINIEFLRFKEEAEKAKVERIKEKKKAEEEARMREDVVVDFAKFDKINEMMCKCVRMFDPSGTPLEVPEIDITDEDIRTKTKLLEAKMIFALETAEKLNKMCVDCKVSMNKMEKENASNVREVGSLREKYCHSLVISVKQYLSSNYPNAVFKEKEELFDELRRNEIPIYDWPAWISQNIMMKKTTAKKKAYKKY